MRKSVLAAALSLLSAAPVLAGGAWVPAAGDGWVQLGASRKTAQSSWSSRGDTIHNQQDHDFRYAYLSGEAGIWKGLSGNWVMTYLDGLEGRPDDLDRNIGLSDAWFGLEYGFRQGTTLPLSVGLTVRTPFFYDQEGPYDRNLYDEDGNVIGHNPEWRGILKYDYTLSFAASRSLWDGGWANFETGYTWREGAPADQLPVSLEVGVPIPWRNLKGKVTGLYVQSMGNDSPRRPNDRFRARPGFNFNNASMGRVGASLMLPVDAQQRWWIEAGYNTWVWGKSARQYDEPFLSFARAF